MRKAAISAVLLLAAAQNAFGTSPLGTAQTALLAYIEPNLGQSATEVTHIARAQGYTAFLRADAVDFRLATRTPGLTLDDTNPLPGNARVPASAPRTIRMQLIGASGDGAQTTRRTLPGHSNYLYGNDQEKWVTHVPHFAALTFDQVYPGIDVVYSLEGTALRYDFVLSPQADAGDIRLRFDGAEHVRLNDNGDLLVDLGDTEMVHSQPKLFQTIDGEQRDVEGGFVLRDDGSLQFRVASYHSEVPLVIDPQITMSTYLGGSGDDSALDVTVDSTNRVVMAGVTDSLDFPGAMGIGGAPTGTDDVYVARFAPDGQSLEFATYVGGTDDDRVTQVAVDTDGNIVVAGRTSSSDFPTVSAIQSTFLGGGIFGSDGFVAKLHAAGSSLIYSTYLGGSSPSAVFGGLETVRGLTVDAAGNAFVTGETDSSDFPANDTVGGRTCLGNEAGAVSPFIGDAFVAKLTPAGALEFAVCVGGSERDTGRGIDLAPDGAIHIVGFTRSPDYPVSANAFQTQQGAPGTGAYDIHVTRLDPSGTQVDFASLVGGNGTEFAQSIVAMGDGSSVVAGSTFSDDFPTTAGAYQTEKALGGNESDNVTTDAMVFRLSAGGTSMRFSTYLGGTGPDSGWSVGVDDSERVYVAANTESLDFPLVNATQPDRGGPGSATGTVGPATDETRDLAVEFMLVNGEQIRWLAAANAGQSRVYELGQGNAVQSTIDIGAPSDDSVAAAFVDLTLDSDADAVVLVNRASPSRIYVSDGAGGFLPPTDLGPVNPNATSIAVGGLLASGEDDVVIGSDMAASVVYIGQPGGLDSSPVVLPGSEATATRAVGIGDFNGDFFSDVVEANQGLNLIYYGNGGGFAAGVPLGGETANSTAVLVFDADLDGDQDIVIGNDGVPNRLYRNDGFGNFVFEDLDSGPASTTDLTLVSLQNDFGDDIVTSDANGGIAYVNNSAGQFTPLPLTATGAASSSVVADRAEGVLRATDGTSIDSVVTSLSDAYLAAFDPSGRELLFSTYLGGGGDDTVNWGLHVQDDANVYVSGNTVARDFPTTLPFQASASGPADGFLTRFALDDLVNPTPSVIYETVIDLAQPTIDGIDQVIIKWSTLNCGESASSELYDYELQLLVGGNIVYSDAVVRNGFLEPFRELPRGGFTWDFDLAGLTLRQLNTGVDLLINQPEAFGTNYLVTDGASLPDDGLILISRWDDGALVDGDEVLIANQTTFVVAGDCDFDGVDAPQDNCLNVPNADQRDTDGDNIGNACDTDLSNDCVVNVVDLGILRTVFFSNDPDADFNGDGIVNILDLAALRLAFFGTPGPSGLPNACQ